MKLLRGAYAKLKQVESKRPFSEREAWNVFRLAALAEAFGWTVLIAAVIINRYHLPGQNIAIPIAGQVHGTIFIAYFCVLIAAYSSLRWSRRTAIIAAAAGVPPYGTLVFEQVVARRRAKALRRLTFHVVARAVVASDDKVLACQPVEDTYWILPGVYVHADESPQETLAREVNKLTGVRPKLGKVKFVTQAKRHSSNELELYFEVKNSEAFAKLDFARITAESDANDDIRFIDPSEIGDLGSHFLGSSTPEAASAAE